MSILVTSAAASEGPFGGIWESPMVGFIANNLGVPTGAVGASAPTTMNSHNILAAGKCTVEGSPFLLLYLDGGQAGQFQSITVQKAGGPLNTYLESAAQFFPPGSTVVQGLNIAATLGPMWMWPESVNDFTVGVVTTLNPASPANPIGGQGDITNPGAWEDSNGIIPPLVFQNVPQTVNFPRNGDGRYWFVADAFLPLPTPITFIGDPAFLADKVSLQWSITQAATDSSGLLLSYSTDGATFVDTQIGPSLQGKSLLSGAVDVDLTALAATTLVVKVSALNGNSSSTATPWNVAVAITRNANESIAWDYPDPFNPLSYNCECMDDVVPTETLLQLRTDILVELGFASQAANPPAGMIALVNSWLIRGQKYLYRRYSQLHTRRMFRWKVNPGQRFYSLKDNDEDVLCNFQMDPNKTIEWAGIQDSRNVWYPLIEGIEPQLYTMIDKPWRPARYEIRQCIEIYPAPDQTYWMWMKAHFGLMTFAQDTDSTTIDATLLFLHVLSIAKAHYGKPDANNVQAMANAYRKELIAGTHGTKRYIPGTVAVPPAIRPTPIQFNQSASG